MRKRLTLQWLLIERLRLLLRAEQRDTSSRNVLPRGEKSQLVSRELRVLINLSIRIRIAPRLQVCHAHALINVLEAVHPAPDSHTLNLRLDLLLDVHPAGNAHEVRCQVLDNGARTTIRVPPRPRVQVVAQLLDASLKGLGEFLRRAVRVFLGDGVNKGAEAGCRVRWAISSDGGEKPAQRAR